MYLPNLVGIVGEFGSGKSLNLLRIGIENASRTRRKLIILFPFSSIKLSAYLVRHGHHWLAQYNRVKYVNPHLSPDNILAAIDTPSAVVLLDEAGIFFNSRDWSKTGKKFLGRLFQLRHQNTTLIYACHFLNQVDKQLREVTQLWFEMKGFTTQGRDGSPRLKFFYMFIFKPARYERWLDDVKARSNLLRTFFMANKTVFKLVKPISALFAVYDSFGSPGSRGRQKPDLTIVDDFSLQNVIGTQFLNFSEETKAYLDRLTA